MKARPANGSTHHSSLVTHHAACAAVLLAAALSGCGTFSSRPSTPSRSPESGPGPAVSSPRPGGYYLDDGPGANPPADLDGIPDAVPKLEPLRSANARPYIALGASYRPLTELQPYRARGLATWYGRRYHGKPTASGEIYDMYAMTGAHTILPIPSYARVTNIKSGRSVVVRINDRGPFVNGRLIDVSYAAAHKLGILAGATMVEVEAILPDGGSHMAVAQSQSGQPANPGGAVAEAPPPAATNAPTGSASATPVATPPPAEEKPAAKPAPVPEVQVATASPPAAIPPVPPVTTEGGRAYLQLGAFGSRENADGFLARLKSQADWLSLQIYTRDGLHRVQSGPYANQAEARQMAERLTRDLGLKPMVLSR